jgi:hypothetical protein
VKAITPLVRDRPITSVLVVVGTVAAIGIVLWGDTLSRIVLGGYLLLWTPDVVRWHRRRSGR